MEILESHEVLILAWWVAVSAGILVASGAVAIIAASNDQHVLFMICALLFIAAICILVFTPTYTPNGQMSYTVEITDPAQYRTLVESEYSFTKLYETKEIYTIIGDVLQ